MGPTGDRSDRVLAGWAGRPARARLSTRRARPDPRGGGQGRPRPPGPGRLPATGPTRPSGAPGHPSRRLPAERAGPRPAFDGPRSPRGATARSSPPDLRPTSGAPAGPRPRPTDDPRRVVAVPDLPDRRPTGDRRGVRPPPGPPVDRPTGPSGTTARRVRPPSRSVRPPPRPGCARAPERCRHRPSPPYRGGPPYRGAAPGWSPPPAIPDDLIAEGDELVAGRRPVEEAFVAGRAAHRLLVVPQRRPALEKIVLHATSLRIPIVEVEGGTLTALAGFDGHQGVALVVAAATLRSTSTRSWPGRSNGASRPSSWSSTPSRTRRTSGRSCAAPRRRPPTASSSRPSRQAPLTPAAVKASAGAVEHLLLAPVDDLPARLADLHSAGSGSSAPMPTPRSRCARLTFADRSPSSWGARARVSARPSVGAATCSCGSRCAARSARSTPRSRARSSSTRLDPAWRRDPGRRCGIEAGGRRRIAREGEPRPSRRPAAADDSGAPSPEPGPPTPEPAPATPAKRATSRRPTSRRPTEPSGIPAADGSVASPSEIPAPSPSRDRPSTPGCSPPVDRPRPRASRRRGGRASGLPAGRPVAQEIPVEVSCRGCRRRRSRSPPNGARRPTAGPPSRARAGPRRRARPTSAVDAPPPRALSFPGATGSPAVWSCARRRSSIGRAAVL